MSEKPIDRGYKRADSISKRFGRNREELLTQNNKPKYKITLTLTYNRTLPNVKEAVTKHWNTLQIINKFKNVFPQPPLMCFHRNKNLTTFFRQKQQSTIRLIK